MSRKIESFANLKKQAMNGKKSVADVEHKIKREFRERLKDLRRKNIDLRREDLADTIVKMSLENTQTVNNGDFSTNYVFTYEESLKLLEEIEEELRMEALNQQAQAYEHYCEKELLYLIDMYDPKS